MDERRFRELLEKRTAAGLSEEEAGELGRLLAEHEGRPYGEEGTETAEGSRAAHGDVPFRSLRTRDQEKEFARR